MTLVLQVRVLGEAVPKGRPRAFQTPAGIRMHTPARTAGYEQVVRVLAQEAMAASSVKFPVTGPVRLTARFYRGIPKSLSRRRHEDAVMGRSLPVVRPDLDNLLKTVKDALNGVVWADDSQICEVRAVKVYGEQPRSELDVETMDVETMDSAPLPLPGETPAEKATSQAEGYLTPPKRSRANRGSG